MTDVKNGDMDLLPLTDAGGHATCVRRVPLFMGLTVDQQDAVGALARPVELERGGRLDAGRRTTRLAVVHAGRVKIVHATSAGHERVVRVAEPGDFVGERAFLTGSDPDRVVEALEHTRLCTFSHEDLSPLIAAHPAIAEAMLRSLSERLGRAEKRLSLADRPGPARVAAYLSGLPGREAASGASLVRLPLRKKDVASYLGMTPESFSRALAALRRRGVIAVGSGVDTVEILDADALDDLAES